MHDIIVIGASAGGVEALKKLTTSLPKGLQAAIFVVVHFPSSSTSVLPAILQRSGAFPATHAEDREPIQEGHIYIGPPSYHMLLADHETQLMRGPREHGFIPAIDPLFRSAAATFGPRVVGVILSGTMGDGASGLHAIKEAGGIAIVQDPDEAIFPEMPLNAIEHVDVDYVLPLSGIARKLVQLSESPALEEEFEMMNDSNQSEMEEIQEDIQGYVKGEDSKSITTLTCPDCGGVIWELREGNILHYRCHIGHKYSPNSMLARQGEALETALSSAVRALEERAMLLNRMAIRSETKGSPKTAARFRQKAEEMERQADVIRQVIAQGVDVVLVENLTSGTKNDH